MESLQKIFKSAEAFCLRHAQEPAIDLTYHYFTQHPVAPLNQRRLKILVECANQRGSELGRPLRILDIACGGGITTCALAAYGHRVLGLDINAAEIRLAKTFAQEERLDGMFLELDVLQAMGWEKTIEQTLGGKPDLVTLAYALHHFPEITPLLRRLGHWLSPGAQLLINEENPDAPSFKIKHRLRTWLQKDTDTEWHRNFKEWKALLEKQGFVVPGPPIGLDLLPGISRVMPEKCWSIVFTAERS